MVELFLFAFFMPTFFSYLHITNFRCSVEYRERYFKKNPITDIISFKNAIKYLGGILQEELKPLIKGIFNFEEKRLTHNSLRYTSISNEIDYRVPIDPGEHERMVTEEVQRYIREHRLPKMPLKYHISKDEDWIQTNFSEYKNKTLSCQYIYAFERIFNVELPRDYKLYLNYVGNGVRLVTLEKAITTDGWFYGFYEEIELDKPFKKNGKLAGALRLFDYGCSVMYYLIIKGDQCGNIFQTNDVIPGISPLFNKEKKQTNFKNWIKKL